MKNWPLKGDIENLTKQFDEFGKMLSMIGDLIYALKDAVDTGLATDDEKRKLTGLKIYRMLLSRIDTSKAPEIE